MEEDTIKDALKHNLEVVTQIKQSMENNDIDDKEYNELGKNKSILTYKRE